jgi:N-acetylglucosaminyldiphosphoundecaprenol N-acetyl-beta-D-mannosaminyltransferase
MTQILKPIPHAAAAITLDDASRAQSALTRDIVSRSLDVIAAALLLLLTMPVWTLAIMMLAVRGRIFVAEPQVGLAGRPFAKLSFALESARWSIEHLPVLLNVLFGEMAVVGPRPLSPAEFAAAGRDGRKRSLVRPGLVCLWWIRRRANIAFGTETASDLEYIATRSLRGDVAILLRAAIAGLYGCSNTVRDNVRLFDLPIDNVTMREAVERIVAQCDRTAPRQVCFVNADCVNLSFKNPAYRRVLQSSWMVLADGIGMKLAGRAFGRDIRENLCGTDVFVGLCQSLAGTGKKLFLLGGRPGVAEGVVSWIERNHPGVRIAGTHHGYFTADQEPDVIRQIAESQADILLVAFGAPRQDQWINGHLAATGVRVALGVGGLFDYYCGRIPRAPLWVREIGMEWLFRVYQEPKRLWKRYFLGNAVFLARLAWWKLTARQACASSLV